MTSGSEKPARSKLIEVDDIKWAMLPEATRELRTLRRSLSADDYAEQVEALKVFLCAYFNSDVNCMGKLHGIAPLGGMPCKGKAFKVKWGLPGGGKSTGIRMAVVVHCDTKRVRIVAAWLRRDDPSDAEFAEAFRQRERER